ncbi:MAG: hypothetical protein WC548_00750 [Candidatus Pacearchaeota archaeon]
MTYNEVYVSIENHSYKVNKANILNSEAHLLKSLKNLRNIAILSRQKHDLRKRLQKTIQTILVEINSLKEKLPIIELPREIKKELKEKTETKTDYSKKEAIDTELKLIQEKLQKINQWM